MKKYAKCPAVVEVITFDELVEYAKSHGAHVVDGVPWSFEYNGHPITHENDKCYIISTTDGFCKFTPKYMLIKNERGDIYPCSINAFRQLYEIVKQGVI